MWTLIVPFKGGSGAKSRLGQNEAGLSFWGADPRRRLALAFLADTVAAVRAVPEVTGLIVVSSDPAVRSALPGTVCLDDPGKGLNAAIEAGLSLARSRNPHGAVAAMTGDLPALTARDLALALVLAGGHPLALVPDRECSGSTLISARPGVEISPRFGSGSRRAHVLAGHAVLPIPRTSTLRSDVDTPEDLGRALRAGVGEHTRAALRLIGAGHAMAAVG